MERIQSHMGCAVVGVGHTLGAAVHAGTQHMHGLVVTALHQLHLLKGVVQRVGCAVVDAPAGIVVLQSFAIEVTVDGNDVGLGIGGIVGVGRGGGLSPNCQCCECNKDKS